MNGHRRNFGKCGRKPVISTIIPQIKCLVHIFDLSFISANPNAYHALPHVYYTCTSNSEIQH